MTRTEISERTGFDNGETFSSDQEVRDYFQRDELVGCIDPTSDARNDIPQQAELDEMAEMVIANRWHIETP